MRFISLLFVVSSIAFFGCSEKKSTTVSDLSSQEETAVTFQVISYRKTPCFGACPQFDLTVMSDGTARYEGKMNVAMMGSWQGQWSDKDIQKVMDVAAKIEYLELEDSYDNRLVMDLPATYTTLKIGEKEKTVMNRYQAPPSLNELYEALETVIAKCSWKKLTNY